MGLTSGIRATAGGYVGAVVGVVAAGADVCVRANVTDGFAAVFVARQLLIEHRVLIALRC